MHTPAMPFAPHMHDSNSNNNRRGGYGGHHAPYYYHQQQQQQQQQQQPGTMTYVPRRIMTRGGYAAPTPYSDAGHGALPPHHHHHNSNSVQHTQSRITASRPLKQLLHHEIALIMLLFSMQSFFERSFGVGGPLSTEMIAGTRFTDYAKPSFSSSSWWWGRPHDKGAFFASSSSSCAGDGDAARRGTLHEEQLPSLLWRSQQARATRGGDDDDDDAEDEDSKSSSHLGRKQSADGDGSDDAHAAMRVRQHGFATNEDVWHNIFDFLPWREVLRMRGVSTTHFRCSLAYVAICRMPYTKTPACFIPAREDFDADEAAVEAALQPPPSSMPRNDATWPPHMYDDSYGTHTTTDAATTAMMLPPYSAYATADGEATPWWAQPQPSCAHGDDNDYDQRYHHVGDDARGRALYGGNSHTSSTCTLDECAVSRSMTTAADIASAPATAATVTDRNEMTLQQQQHEGDANEVASSPVVAAPAPATMQRMFFGQLRRDGTVPMVRWLLHYVFDAPAWALHTVENHRHRRTALGKGCAWPTIADAATVSRLLDAHHRLFYDRLDGGVEGVWLVPHAHTHTLAVEAAHRYVARAHPRHMPRATFVAELSASPMVRPPPAAAATLPYMTSAAIAAPPYGHEDYYATRPPPPHHTSPIACAPPLPLPLPLPQQQAAHMHGDVHAYSSACGGEHMAHDMAMAHTYYADTVVPAYDDTVYEPCAEHDDDDGGVVCDACATVAAETASVASSDGGNSDAAASTTTMWAAATATGTATTATTHHDSNAVTVVQAQPSCTTSTAAAATATTTTPTTTSLSRHACAMTAQPYTPAYATAHADHGHRPLHHAAVVVHANGMWRNNPYQPILIE